MGFHDFIALSRSRIASWRRWLCVLTEPVVRTPGLFASIVLMLTVVPFGYYFYVKPGMLASPFTSALLMLAEAAVVGWSVLAVYGLLLRFHKVAGRLWLFAIFVPLTANWMIDLVLMHVYRCSFTKDIAGVIMATDMSEGANFIEAYFTADLCLWAVSSLAVFAGSLAAFACLRRYLCRLLSHGVKMAVRMVVVASLAGAWIMVIFSDSCLVTGTNFRNKIATFATLDTGHAVVPQNPSVAHDPSDAPRKIVVIIGESLCRSHCSLYGYEKCTQPLLELLRDRGELYVFSHPSSPAVHTMASLQRIVGTWDGDPRVNWYECPTFIEIARLSGYRVSWISNQSCKGVYDNPVVKIAEFCDRRRFTSDGMYGIESGGYDEAIVAPVKEWIDDRKDLTVIHLMGSHVSYANRYPPGYAVFKASDYGHLPSTQRSTVACYDNSVLYNDSVVGVLMAAYAGQDAVVFYFSDHAQDLYDTDPAYFGHSRPEDPASVAVGKAVPLLVYMSPVFQTRHPGMARRIAASVGNDADLSNFTYTLMDVMHTRFTDNDDVIRKTFFLAAESY